jgi:hypothetical protein
LSLTAVIDRKLVNFTSYDKERKITIFSFMLLSSDAVFILFLLFYSNEVYQEIY